MDVIHSDTDGNNRALTCLFQLEERQESKREGTSCLIETGEYFVLLRMFFCCAGVYDHRGCKHRVITELIPSGQSGSAVSTYYTTEPLLKILNHVTLKLKRRMF